MACEAGSISRNGLPVDPMKDREWRQRSARKYADKRAEASRNQRRNEARLTTKTKPRLNADWTPRVRKLARARSHGICEIDDCNRAARHLHHRKLRAHGDHRICNALHVCVWHHDRIHGRHRDWRIADSRIAGWLVPARQDPARVVVLISGGDRVLLTNDGKYEDAA